MQVNRQSLLMAEGTGMIVLANRVQGHKAREMSKRKEANSGKNPKYKRV